MLDHYLALNAQKEEDRDTTVKLAAWMQDLPVKTLQAIVAGKVKIADLIPKEGHSGEDWLAKFQGSPMFAAAVELEKADLQNEIAQQQATAAVPKVEHQQFYETGDQIRLQKKMLDLQLIEGQEMALGSPPMQAVGQLPDQAAEAQGAGALGNAAATTEQPVADGRVALASVQANMLKWADGMGRSLAQAEKTKIAIPNPAGFAKAMKGAGGQTFAGKALSGIKAHPELALGAGGAAVGAATAEDGHRLEGAAMGGALGAAGGAGIGVAKRYATNPDGGISGAFGKYTKSLGKRYGGTPAVPGAPAAPGATAAAPKVRAPRRAVVDAEFTPPPAGGGGPARTKAPRQTSRGGGSVQGPQQTAAGPSVQAPPAAPQQAVPPANVQQTAPSVQAPVRQVPRLEMPIEPTTVGSHGQFPIAKPVAEPALSVPHYTPVAKPPLPPGATPRVIGPKKDILAGEFGNPAAAAPAVPELSLPQRGTVVPPMTASPAIMPQPANTVAAPQGMMGPVGGVTRPTGPVGPSAAIAKPKRTRKAPATEPEEVVAKKKKKAASVRFAYALQQLQGYA